MVICGDVCAASAGWARTEETPVARRPVESSFIDLTDVSQGSHSLSGAVDTAADGCWTAYA